MKQTVWLIVALPDCDPSELPAGSSRVSVKMITQKQRSLLFSYCLRLKLRGTNNVCRAWTRNGNNTQITEFFDNVRDEATGGRGFRRFDIFQQEHYGFFVY